MLALLVFSVTDFAQDYYVIDLGPNSWDDDDIVCTETLGKYGYVSKFTTNQLVWHFCSQTAHDGVFNYMMHTHEFPESTESPRYHSQDGTPWQGELLPSTPDCELDGNAKNRPFKMKNSPQRSKEAKQKRLQMSVRGN